MDYRDCIKFANENPICWVATVDNNKPKVRGLAMWFADESGFYFQTGSIKAIYNQLKSNSNIELCFYKPGDKSGIMLRIAGEAELLDDINLKNRVIKDRPFLKDLGLSPESPNLIIFRVQKGEAYFWNWENNLKAKEIIKF